MMIIYDIIEIIKNIMKDEMNYETNNQMLQEVNGQMLVQTNDQMLQEAVLEV